MRTRLRTIAAGIALTVASTVGVAAAAPATAIEPVGFDGVRNCADPKLNAFDNWSGHTLGAYKDTNWVPQGMTYDAKGDQLYVSMYHRDAAEVPRVVVYQRSTSAWVKTIELSGVPKSGHAGGLTIGRGNLYVSDSAGGSFIYRVPIDTVRSVPAGKRQAVKTTRYALKNLGHASYVDYYAGSLYVGDFYSNLMRRYATSTSGAVALSPSATYGTPSIVQGVQVTGSHFVFSRSWGRDNLSKVTTQVRSSGKRTSHNTLPMMEGIVWAPRSAGSSVKRLYSVFESTSKAYADSNCRTHAIWSASSSYIL
ncbi:hypothetical protein GCM10023258_15750 [Terrabacter aeriphilus]|uniref:Sugar lactone lactonase YvrE n=1 Tax=Terrabacter aeriphilus TaxID=515662 RepID=A0ABP9JAC9_9MICO